MLLAHPAPHCIGPQPSLPPSLHHRRVLYHPTGAFSALLWFVEISMGIVCACATVASVRGIILNWTTYKLFAS